MSANTLHDLAEIICDEKAYPASKGYKTPASPSFVFFDDEREADGDILWGRELALDFEEFVARRNHEEALDSRMETKLFLHTNRFTLEPKPLVPAKNGGAVTASMREMKWAEKFSKVATRKPNPRSVVESEWKGGYIPEKDKDAEAYVERQESKRYGNWLVNFHKKRPKNNDHARKFAMVAMKHIDNPVAKALMQALKESLPTAPGPIRSTVFVNPDGSRHQTNGTDFGKAKASYQKRHGITDEFVTVDRVQYEHERASRLVVGMRKSSAEAPSSYYDPDPTYEERLDNGDPDPQTYRPQAVTLIRMPRSKVVPAKSHNLTVRQFERAIIAGATLEDSEIEAYASSLDYTDECPDRRESQINMGYGDTARTEDSFSHEEAYLYGVLMMFGLGEAAELMKLGEQPQGLLSMHFMAGGEMTEEYLEILKFVSDKDKAWQKGELSDEEMLAQDRPMFQYVVNALANETEFESVSGHRNPHLMHCAIWDADNVRVGDTIKQPAYHNWG